MSDHTSRTTPAARETAAKTAIPSKAAESAVFNAHAVIRMQRYVGNSGVQRLLKSGTVLPGTHPARIQRDDAPEETPIEEAEAAEETTEDDVPASTITVDAESITTYEQAAAFFGKRETELISVKGDFSGAVSAPASLELAIQESRGWRSIWSNKEGNMYEDELANISTWFTDYFLPAYNDAQVVQADEVTRQMQALQAKLSETAAAANNVVGPLRQLQRAMYRAEDNNKLLETANALAGYLDMALASKGSIDQIVQAVDSLKPWRVNLDLTKRVPPVESKVPKVLSVAESVNKVYAAFQIGQGAFKMMKASTDANKALAGIEMMATVASAGGTILGMSATFGLWANIYLGPMVSAIVSNLKVVNEYYSGELNKYALEVGDPDDVIWSLEEGGRPMYDFMVPVMQASDWSGVPSPVPQPIMTYFEKNAERMTAGVGAKPANNILFNGNDSSGGKGEAMPMEGRIDHTPDTQRIKYWVFNNRANIWAMLYGDLSVPN
jgi:hypothetical protein